MNSITKYAVAFALAVSFAPSAHAVTISNTLGEGMPIFYFGMPNTQTYGQVFTAPESGILTSFSLSLTGGVGQLFGGVGDWSGTSSTFELSNGPTTFLYQGAPVMSEGAQTYTFSPDVAVTAGLQYVIFLSVSGLELASGQTMMPTGTGVSGFNYFVWNTDALATGPWNYFDDRGQALASVTISPVPLPAALPLFGAGLGGLAFFGRRKKIG